MNNEFVNTITVSGRGETAKKPDVAYITLGLETMHKDPAKAQNENAQIMGDIISALKKKGLSDKDIKTMQYNVHRQAYHNSKDKSYTYRVTNTVQAAVNDVDRAGEVISAAASAGANIFGGISFDIKDKDAAYSEALKEALNHAKQKAQLMAAETGRAIGEVLSIQEGGARAPMPAPMLRSARSNMSAEAAVSPGQLEISAGVNVVYRLK